MDYTDKLLIALLTENSRLSYKELSKKVHLSQPAVKERIVKLVENNEITKFTIETKNLSDRIQAFIYIKTTKCMELEKYLQDVTAIIKMYRMSGTYNYCIEFYGEDLNSLLLFQKSLRKYGSSQLHIVTERII